MLIIDQFEKNKLDFKDLPTFFRIYNVNYYTKENFLGKLPLPTEVYDISLHGTDTTYTIFHYAGRNIYNDLKIIVDNITNTIYFNYNVLIEYLALYDTPILIPSSGVILPSKSIVPV